MIQAFFLIMLKIITFFAMKFMRVFHVESYSKWLDFFFPSTIVVVVLCPPKSLVFKHLSVDSFFLSYFYSRFACWLLPCRWRQAKTKLIYSLQKTSPIHNKTCNCNCEYMLMWRRRMEKVGSCVWRAKKGRRATIWIAACYVLWVAKYANLDKND